MSYRDTWADISLDAIEHNVRLFKSTLSGSCRLMAVVKANGYGHGAVEVARTALEAGASHLGVALLDEALQLRAAEILAPILLLGYTPTRSVEAAVKNDIDITIFSESQLDEVIACTNRLRRKAVVHLKVDTGMTRLGVTSWDEALALCLKAASSEFVKPEGLFTHFADADRLDSPYTRKQFELFLSLIKHLQANQVHIPIKHCCNSAATLLYPDMHLDMVRVGIGLYGLQPSSVPLPKSSLLWPAIQFKTQVSSVKLVLTGQSIGYGCTFQPTRDSHIAILPVGYADGWPRSLSNKGSVWLSDGLAPIVGRICMDQMMVDVTDIPNVQVGDDAILMGGPDHSPVSVEKIASQLQTINYEVVCAVGKRVPRYYVRGIQKKEYTEDLAWTFNKN